MRGRASARPVTSRRAHEWLDEVYDKLEEREALFETIRASRSSPSTPRRTAPTPTPSATSATRASTRSPAASTPRCTGAGSGRCASSPGFGTAEETNERFRYLLDHGQTGLSTAFDMPTLMGLDSDHGRSLGEVGVEGVAIDTARRHGDAVRRASRSDEVTTSMTINAPAAILLAFYVCRRRGEGDPARPARRHDPDRHPQGVHRPEGVVLPDRAGDAPGRAT